MTDNMKIKIEVKSEMKHEDYVNKILSMFDYTKTNSFREIMKNRSLKSFIADSDQIQEVKLE